MLRGILKGVRAVIHRLTPILILDAFVYSICSAFTAREHLIHATNRRR